MNIPLSVHSVSSCQGNPTSPQDSLTRGVWSGTILLLMKPLRALELIVALADRRIAVVGDLMLDRYIWGDAKRISQEAPVPVVEVARTTAAPGGAANVVRNLAALGAKASAFGVVGDDSAANDLLRLLAEAKVDVTGILRDASRVTTEKTRVIAGHQQVVRVDTERAEPLSPEQEAVLLKNLEASIAARAIDGVIVEDYAKGLISESLLPALAALCAQHRLPIALDPHPANPACARGLTVITPNRAEAFAMAGVYPRAAKRPALEDNALLEVVRILQDKWAPACLLITLGADGMALFRAEAAPLHIPTRAREVYDVSGAGDTVVATFMLALTAGATPDEAAHLANHAAGIVVSKIGTAAVSPEELATSFRADAQA